MASDLCLNHESELLLPQELKKHTRLDLSIQNPMKIEDEVYTQSSVLLPVQHESQLSSKMLGDSQNEILKAPNDVPNAAEACSVSEFPSPDLECGLVISLPNPSNQCSRTSPEAGKSQESRSSCSQSSFNDAGVCRICHDGEEKEELVSPCRCSGSVGLLHISCLERWLGTSHRTRCELCRYQFALKKIKPPLREFFKDPPSPEHRVNLICDFTCFLILTPVTVISIFLCIKTTLRYSQWPSSWQLQGLILLTACLIVIYFTWFGVVIHYHITTFQTWQMKNQIVKMKAKNLVNHKAVHHALKCGRVVTQCPPCSSHHLDTNQQNSEHAEAIVLTHLILKRSTNVKGTSWQCSVVNGSRPENTAEVTHQAEQVERTKMVSAKEDSPVPEISSEENV